MNIISNLVEVHIFKETEEGIKFLLLKRAESEIYPGIWQMVTGHIDDGEKATETALREMKEETGITPLKMWVVPNVNQYYSAQKDYICLIPVFAVLVDNKAECKLCNEHCEQRWCTPEEAKQLLAWPGQKKSVDIIYEYFSERMPLLNFTQVNIS